MPGKIGRSPAQQKLDSHLYAAAQRARDSLSAAPADVVGLLELDGQGHVHVEIQGTVSPSLLEEIVSLGGRVESTFPSYRTIRAWVPVTSPEILAARPDVTFIKPAALPRTNLPR